MDDIDGIKKRMKEKRKFIPVNKVKNNFNDDNKKVYYSLSKVLILLVMFLGILIYSKTSPQNKLFLYENIFVKNFSFTSMNNLYQKYLGGVLPFEDLWLTEKPMFKEKLVFKDSNIYKDGVVLTVTPNYLVPVQESGIIIFIGEKEGYGETVIIQQTNGVDLWYGNIKNINAKIYDYVEQGSFLGETIDNKLYLVYKQEGAVLNYKDYLN